MGGEEFQGSRAWAERQCRVEPFVPGGMAALWQDKAAMVVEVMRANLAVSHASVVCAEATHGSKGWLITAYVSAKCLKANRAQLVAFAQQAVVFAVNTAPHVFLMGFAANPFIPMPLGFGAAIGYMPDKHTACRSSYSMGFCPRPGTCCWEHPKDCIGIQVCLKPARKRV